MNEYLQEFISLKENYKLQDGNKSSILALYQFADRLSVINEKEAKEVLVDVYLPALSKISSMGRCGLK